MAPATPISGLERGLSSDLMLPRRCEDGRLSPRPLEGRQGAATCGRPAGPACGPAEPDWRERAGGGDGVLRNLSWLFEGRCWEEAPLSPGHPRGALPYPNHWRFLSHKQEGTMRALCWQPGAQDSAARLQGQSPSLLLHPHLLQQPFVCPAEGHPQFTSQIRGTDSSWGGEEGKAQAHREGERGRKLTGPLLCEAGGGCLTSQKVLGPASQILSPQ